MMVDGEFPTYLTRTIIRAAGTSEPMNALVTMPALDRAEENENPMIMAVTAPRQAPEEIPVVYASASGFSMMLCITAPAKASPAPATSAMTTPGMTLFTM